MTLVLNKDVNARQKDYEHLTYEQLLVTKIFPTVQGEGPYAGWPAVFVRLAGCNLGLKESCPWCDTYFALGAGQPMDFMQILGAAGDDFRAKLMVLTGGEPLMQPNVKNFIKRAIVYGWKVQVETNGYFWREEFEDVACGDFSIVISPKVNARQVYPPIHPALLKASDCLKILVDSDPASPYHELPIYHSQYRKLIYLSPINAYERELNRGEVPTVWADLYLHEGGPPLDSPRCLENHRYAARLAMKYGYRVSLQTHLMLGLE